MNCKQIFALLTFGVVIANAKASSAKPRDPFQVALDHLKTDQIEVEVAEFTIDCHYKIGQAKWRQFSDHPCNRLERALVKVNSRDNNITPIEKSLALAYKVVLDQKEEEERAFRCLIKPNAKDCTGLSNNIPQELTYKGGLTRLYFFLEEEKLYKLTEQNYIEARKNSRKTNVPIKHGHYELAFECFMHRNEYEYPACFGLTWGRGYPFVTSEDTLIKPLFEQLVASCHCDAPSLGEESTNKAIAVGMDCSARAHVRMCVRFQHYKDINRVACDGITFYLEHQRNSIEANETRAFFRLVEAEMELQSKIREKEDDWEFALMFECQYTWWITKPPEKCQFILPSTRVTYLYKLAQKTFFINKVVNCIRRGDFSWLHPPDECKEIIDGLNKTVEKTVEQEEMHEVRKVLQAMDRDYPRRGYSC